MNIKTEIISALKNLSKELVRLPARQGVEDVNFLVEKPENESFGDYSSNIALTLFTQYKVSGSKYQVYKTPLELAQEIVKILNTKYLIHNTDRVEAVAPGFINFWISKEYLIDNLSKFDNLNEPLKNKRIMVEFTDPNPFKEFHIGHLYSNTVGESISRMLTALGANVKRANYQGDVGMHVAKALYGILHLCHAEFSSASQILKNKIRKLEQDDSLSKRIKFLGEAYAFGAKKYEEDEKAKKEIEELNKKIYAKDPDVAALYEKGRQWSLEYFESIYKRLGTKFDFYYFESEVGIEGLKLVKEFLKKKVFEESQGAVIFPGEKYGLHNRVFINSLGLPTYEAKDLGLAFKKYSDFKFNQSIVITGSEIIGYFKVILAALKQINPEVASKIKHLPHGMVRLPTGKMSSRSGNVLTGEWLLDEAKKLLKSKYPEMEEDTLEKVAVGSVKYALLKSSIGHDIEFDFEESINIQGNSGPYLQYTFARTQSVLSKAHDVILNAVKDLDSSPSAQNDSRMEQEEVSLLRSLIRFPEVVEEAGEKFAPNLLCNYLFDLAQKFNLFYQKHKILQSRTSEKKDFRLALTAAVGKIIEKGLNLLGIQSPERM